MLVLRRSLPSVSKKTLSPTLSTRSVSSGGKGITLEYQAHITPDVKKEGESVLILHGLLGSKRNWNSLAQDLSKSLGRSIYTLDLRNHGSSPHVPKMTYMDMAEDVLEFIDKHNLKKTTIIGHSMGGKVAMSVALNPYLDAHTDILKNLVVVDIAPVKATMSPEFHSYVEAMQKIENSRMKTRKEAAEFLSTYEKDPSIRAFLLTNLETPTSNQPYAKFRVPVDIINKAVPDLGDFPYSPGERVWKGRTLFVKGSRSAYISHHRIPLIQSFFPDHTIETLDAGHWVHAERPNEFKELVTGFV